MKILMLNPKSLYQSWPLENDFIKYFLNIPSLTFPQLAACLGPGYDCRILDGSMEKLLIRNYIHFLKDNDVVCISVPSALMSLNVELHIKLLHHLSPKTKIVIGGYHGTLFHGDWVEKGADFVVRGEGEETFAALISMMHSGETNYESISGLTFKRDGAVVSNPDRGFIESLDSLPVPRFDMLNLNLYDLRFRRNGYTGSVETTRGCAYHCNFCMVQSMWRNTYRVKSVDRVIEEIGGLTDLGVTQLAFLDNNFGDCRERDSELCEEILRKKIDIRFWAFMRSEPALENPDFPELLSKAGLRQIYIGYESLDGNMLLDIKKAGKTALGYDNYRRAYEIYRRNGIFVTGLFMTGYPMGKQAGKPTLNLYNKICDDVRTTNYRPVPGSPGWKKISERGASIKNMFYHDRYLQSIENNKEKQGFRAFFLVNFLNVVNFKVLRALLFGSYLEKNYYRGQYLNLAKGFLRVSFGKIDNFMIMMNPRFSTDEKEKKLVAKHTSFSHINNLLRKAGINNG